jgi:fibronectin type 3 domain-containing protein
MTASDRLELTWSASPSTTVTQYQISVGTASGRYEHVIAGGIRTSYTEMDVIAGQTYYVVVRASDAHGALSDPSPEVHITMPALVPTRLTLTGSNPAVGSETTRLTATVADQFGRPLSGAQVTFAAPGGVRLEVVNDASRVASSTIQVTRVDPQLTSAMVRATSGTATDGLEVLFTAPTATPTATSRPTGTPTATGTPGATGTPNRDRDAYRDEHANAARGRAARYSCADERSACLTQPDPAGWYADGGGHAHTNKHSRRGH